MAERPWKHIDKEHIITALIYCVFPLLKHLSQIPLFLLLTKLGKAPYTLANEGSLMP